MERPLKIYQTIPGEDKESLRLRMNEIVDMVKAKIEAGEVDSLAFLMVGPDPDRDGDTAYTGSRFLVRPAHMDLVEDVYNEMMHHLTEHYGVTPEQLRAERKHGPR